MANEFKTFPLGFGLMRLPTVKNAEIDIDKVCEMVDAFIKGGGTYFDTAYFYHDGNSEAALNKAVVQRYPRDKYTVADKMPPLNLQTRSDLERIFKGQLEKTGLDYFDYYLLHAIGEGNIEQFERAGAWQWAKEMKAAGKIKTFGFSFHGTPPLLEKLLKEHPEVEFVQLQINYADWNHESIASKTIYDIARKYNVPIIVMEPLKGGYLSSLKSEFEDILYAVTKDVSIASWAVRYVLQLQGVFMMLSGMSTLDQVLDNVKTVQAFTPLSEKESAALKLVKEKLDALPIVACTNCKYCVEGCPKNIKIPNLISIYNDYLTYEQPEKGKGSYTFTTENSGKAIDCIECKKCEVSCPQHLPIIDTLAKISKLFDN